MDEATLQIKFIPVFKKINQDSKCYLEIVPEVSSITELDVVEYMKCHSTFEYSIPIMYKLKLINENTKSLLQVFQNVQDTNKTYHSCVDLIRSPLISSTDLASGDIVRHFSENLILSKMVSRIDRIESSCHETNVKESYVQASQSECKEIMNVQSQQTDDEIDMMRCFLKDFKFGNDLDSIHKASKDSLSNSKEDKAVNSDISFKNCALKYENSGTCTTNNLNKSYFKIETDEEQIADNNLTVKCSSKSKLSISPLCSIDTSDTLVPQRDVKTSTSSLVIYTKKTVHSKCIESYNYIPKKVINKHQTISSQGKNNKVYTIDTNLPKKSYFNNQDCMDIFLKYGPTDGRISAIKHCRVQQFMSCIEKEILPLKLGLEDLISKCCALGFRSSNGWSICNGKMLKNINEKRKDVLPDTNKKFDSNRVVYSYVFDG